MGYFRSDSVRSFYLIIFLLQRWMNLYTKTVFQKVIGALNYKIYTNSIKILLSKMTHPENSYTSICCVSHIYLLINAKIIFLYISIFYS